MAVFKKLIEKQNSDFGNLFRCLRNHRIAGKFGELTRFEHLAKESLAN